MTELPPRLPRDSPEQGLAVPQVMIRLADPQRDNQALCALSRACPQGGRLRFYHLRNDHWARCGYFSEAQVWVAEWGDRIVGAGSFACKPVWLAGRREPVAYFFDRLVHPDSRRRGIGRALLQQELTACEGTSLQYGLVLEDNVANRRLLESEGFICHPRRLLYLALVPALAGRRIPADLHLLEPMHPAEGDRLDRQFRQTHTFVDETTASGSGLFVLGAREVRAAGVLYRHGPKVVTRAPWLYDLLGRLLSLVPRLNTPAKCWGLGHIWAEHDRALAELLSGVAAAARRERVSLVLLPLYENDPRLSGLRRSTVNRWGIGPTRVCLYVQGAAAGAVLRASQPFLASPRDG